MHGGIEAKIREIIAEQLGIGEDDILPSSTFVEDLGADSLDVCEVVMAIEEEFELDISESETENFATMQDVVLFVKTRTVV